MRVRETTKSSETITSRPELLRSLSSAKTIAELETLLSKRAEAVVDAVTGATLTDTPGYLQSVVAAAKAAK